MKNLKLQSQLSNRIFHHDNNKLYSHLEKQINSLDEQISKFVLLVKQLSQDESELSNRKCGIEQEMKQINDNISTYRQTRSTLNEQAPQMNKISDISKHTHESSICISDHLSIKQARKCSISEVTESEAIVKEQTIKKMKVDYITKKRLSTDFKTLENDQNHLRIALKRKSPNYRQEESSKNSEHLKQKRKCPDYKLAANTSNKTGMATKHSNEPYHNDEIMQKRQYVMTSKFGNNLTESIRKFLEAVSEGPVYVCSSYHQTHFANNVVDVCNLHPQKHQTLLETCLTNFKSVNNKEWICLSCKREIYAGLVPKLSTANKVGFPKKPPELELNALEEFLAAPLSAFMRIRSLPVCGITACGQKLMIGNVVHVPNDIGSTLKTLPHMLSDMETIPVNIKRKKSYKTTVFSEFISPNKVIKAVKFLVANSEMYKSYNIDVPTWLHDIENSTHDNQYFIEGNNLTVDQSLVNLEENDSNNDTNFEEITSSEISQGNMDTMLIEHVNTVTEDSSDSPQDSTGNEVYTLTPGEGQILVFEGSLSEYKAFPTIFCGQTRPSNSERIRPVHISDLFKVELRHVDPRVALNISNIFYRAKFLQRHHIKNRVTLALRRLVSAKHKNVTAENLLNKNERHTIRKLDEGYHIYRSLRNSPPYFEKFKKDVLGMVRQLGIPTLFFSLSSADTGWISLLQCIGKVVDKVTYSDDFIKNEMSFEKKCQLVSSHPAACSRYFQHRVQQFIKFIIKGPYSPFGQVLDFVHRVEFQKRGSPHIHGLLWIHNAPRFGTSSDEDLCKYIDSCISCSTDVTDSEKDFLKLQIHKHSRTFSAKHTEIMKKLAVYEPMSSVLESALDNFEKDTFDELCVAPSAQHENDDETSTDNATGHELAFHEPDNSSAQHLVDIGPLLGIAPVHTDNEDIELIPNIISDDEYYDLLGKLNRKQQEFHVHIMQQSQQNNNQILCALHGGAGSGKSLVIHAIHQGLYRLLNKRSGEDHSIQHILLVAPTGKAASNIRGSTIHKAFMIPANQKLEHKPLSWDHLNAAHNKFYGIKWILIDEFSMVGNTMLRLIHLRLQEIKGNHLPFGGVNIICVGDLYQLAPVMQQYIFMDINIDYGPLATNLWKTYFTMFELTEIMRQKDDQPYAELLNRL